MNRLQSPSGSWAAVNLIVIQHFVLGGFAPVLAFFAVCAHYDNNKYRKETEGDSEIEDRTQIHGSYSLLWIKLTSCQTFSEPI